MKRQRTVRILDERKTAAKCIARTNELVIGRTYFLSMFYEKEGAMVRVLSTSTKTNRAGWPSTVEYEVIETIGEDRFGLMAPGKRDTCNAANLYSSREDANPRK